MYLAGLEEDAIVSIEDIVMLCSTYNVRWDTSTLYSFTCLLTS